MRIVEALIQLIFGWPGIITSILLSIAGVLLKRPGLLVAAGIVGLPFAIYLTAGSRMPGFLLPFFHFGAAYALRRNNTRMAWLLVAPMIIVAVLLGYAVLTQ